MTPQERLERATHEAGHVVAAVAQGIPVGRVSIRGGRSNHGVVEIADDEGSLEARAIVRLAGREALLLAGLPVRGCGQDTREARALAVEQAGETNADLVLAEWRARTRVLLFDRDRWREHGAVALALLERETVTGSELPSIRWRAAQRRTASPA